MLEETEELEREIQEDGLVLEGEGIGVEKRRKDMERRRRGEGKARKRVKKDGVMGGELIKLTVE